MSCNFEVQVEVFPCTAEQSATIAAVIERWGMEVDGETESFDDNYPDGWCWWGSIQLVGGQTEQEKHEELQRLLPDHHVVSRWRWVDDQPWDETFLSEPLTPAA